MAVKKKVAKKKAPAKKRVPKKKKKPILLGSKNPKNKAALKAAGL